MNSNSTEGPDIGIIILAAGRSSRMGQPKQLLTFKGKNLLQHVIDRANSVNQYPLFVVLGAFEAQIKKTIPDLDGLTTVTNYDWESGMGSSVVTGVRTAIEHYPGVAKLLLLVVDQPWIDANHLKKLIDTSNLTNAKIVATRYHAVLGVPAIFDRSLFSELLALNESVGARKLIRKYNDEVVALDFPRAAKDLDYPEEWMAFLKEIGEE